MRNIIFFALSCPALVVWPVRCAGQAATFTLTPQDFQSRKAKIKRENLEYFSHNGLVLRDRTQAGRLRSDSIELPSDATAIVLQWGSSLPADDLTIRVQLSSDGKVWSEWFVANEQAQLNPRNNLFSGRAVSGFGKARYIRYEAEIRPEPPGKVSGCLTVINLISVSSEPPMNVPAGPSNKN